jgi:uncharacterized lipoprotein YmbA
VRQFHARSGGDAILEATWTVEDGHTGKVFVRRGGNYFEPVVMDGYEGIVAAENRLLSRFSKDIAESFRGR